MGTITDMAITFILVNYRRMLWVVVVVEVVGHGGGDGCMGYIVLFGDGNYKNSVLNYQKTLNIKCKS